MTNAIVHGSGLIDIRLAYESGSLTVYVHDQGDGRPFRRHPAGDWEFGRGLELIDGLVALYGGIRGVFGDDDRRGKTVFVTLPLTRDPEGTR